MATSPVEVESRTQGLRPRTQKKIRGQGQPFRGQTLSRPRTGMLEAKDRNAQGQGPRTQAQGFSNKKKVYKNFFSGNLKKNTKKRSSNKFFRQSPQEEYKRGLCKFSARFLAFSCKILRVQKTVLSLRRGQGSFQGLGASRPRPRT